MTTKKTAAKTGTKTAARKMPAKKTTAAPRATKTAPAPQPEPAQHAPSRAPLVVGLSLACLGFVMFAPPQVQATVDTALYGPAAR